MQPNAVLHSVKQKTELEHEVFFRWLELHRLTPAPGEQYRALFVDTLVKTNVSKCDKLNVYSCVGGINDDKMKWKKN